MNLVQVALDPGSIAQGAFVRDRLDDDGARSGAVGLGTDFELDALADGSLEFAVDLAIGPTSLPFTARRKSPGLTSTPGCSKRGAEGRIPVGPP